MRNAVANKWLIRSNELMVLEDLLDILEDDLHLALGVHVLILLEGIVVVDDLEGLLVVGPEAFLYAVDVIVRAAAGLPALEEALEHHLLAADQVQDEGDVHLLAHELLPRIEVLEVAREAVDEEAAAVEAVLLHGPLQQHHRDLARHDLPLDDVLLDDLAELRPWLLALRPQKVPRREVHELEVALDPLALRTLPRTGPAQDEDHCCVLTHQHNKFRQDLIIATGQQRIVQEINSQNRRQISAGSSRAVATPYKYYT